MLTSFTHVFIDDLVLSIQVNPMPNQNARNSRITPFHNISESLIIPPHLKVFLPRKWELLGDVLLMKIPEELKGYKEDIASAYSKELNAKSVLQDLGIEGDFREPKVEVLLGSETETIHKENGVKFKMDCAKVMFSSGNIDERIRMATISNSNEVVVDMFAGIGFFTIPIAVHSKPKSIFALEMNPTAHHYLSENVLLNDVNDIVRPVMGDNQDFEKEKIADRIIMGYLDNTQTYLKKALDLLRPEGGIIHYHEKCPNELLDTRPLENMRKEIEGTGRQLELLNIKNIKSYAPGVSHIVLDVKVYSA
jgi:tRNA wybutosine-synthesizing protein 2